MKRLNRYSLTLENLKNTDNYRFLPENNYNNLIDLCSNDYLSINSDKQLYHNFINSLKEKDCTFSSCSSRLLYSNSVEHIDLEKIIANCYKSEACLLFNSGYHANVGIISALAGKKDLIVADKLAHASIIDGAKLSQATVVRFKHLDYLHLEKIIEKNRNLYENLFIISESIFSMDGDVANIAQLIALKKKYNCLLYIDEAHAIGVRGGNGLGCVEEAQQTKEVDFIVGTFGKAMASMGAYVVCSNMFKEYLVNHSRTFIFSTALPPINIAWTSYIFKKLPEFNQRRKDLSLISTQFSNLLGLKPQSHIVPYIIGSNKQAVVVSQKLMKNGFYVLPIRYPTVPKGTARLRFSFNSNININQIIPIIDILKKYE